MERVPRRTFFKHSIAAGATLIAPKTENEKTRYVEKVNTNEIQHKLEVSRNLDLAPAQWIWFPSERCLANTVILFRKSIELPAKPAKATGWILGESRYKLYVNGNRVQFGPAPSDPRWSEADPVNIGEQMTAGKNVIGAEVLYYGQGDGTWPIGKPGFIFQLNVEFDDGKSIQFVSDESWQCSVARSWKPGQYKRWYLRALQEEFDARLYPSEWNTVGHANERNWRGAMKLDGPSNKPVISARYRDYLYDSSANPANAELRPRSITMPAETWVPVKRLRESLWLRWTTMPEEYFEFVTPEPFEAIHESLAEETSPGEWIVKINNDQAALLTFEFAEQIVGFPAFTIDAPEGAIIEVLVHEAHAPGTDPLINTHFHSWSRFVCTEGENRFETFDYESLRWLQLHIRNASRAVTLRDVGVRRRMFDWKNKPVVNCSDPVIQKVLNASINTLYNCAIETIVDGMGRERQQYSGDVGHVLHAVFHTMGEPTVAARFINTFSQGITSAGYFLDCWPAFDRLARLMEREMQLTEWGPLLDHGVGFNFDVYHYYLYTGETQSIQEAFPRLLKFFNYLVGLIREDGLLPVEGIGVPVVWIDHIAYQKQRHKKCAFNLYAAAMMENALYPLCVAFRERETAAIVRSQGRKLLQATVREFWSREKRTFVNNLPWLKEEGSPRMCDRSIATALLFGQCPDGETADSVQLLVDPPENLGMSYPANTGWRYWALSRFGRSDVFIREVRDKWAKIDSVHLNNTLAEDWHAQPDSNSQWSHCPIVPLYGMHMCVAGITPLEPGLKSVLIAPQTGDLESLEITSRTVQGDIHLSVSRQKQKTKAVIDIPPNVKATFRWKEKDYELKAGRNTLTV